VVGAGISYGPGALATATAVKLSRTLWIVPLTLAIAFGIRRRQSAAIRVSGDDSKPAKKIKIASPWFIGYFLLASLLRSYVPAISTWSPHLSEIPRRKMILVLFLIGTSLSFRALRSVVWRTMVAGLTLWPFVSITSLVAIISLKLTT